MASNHQKKKSGISNTDSVSDAVKGNWVEHYAPKAFIPYLQLMRMDRPIGTYLLFWPCSWGIALANFTQLRMGLSIYYIMLFFLGALIMRGAGCTINDILDRHIDAQVKRTASRPIPSGRISVTEAFILCVVLSLVGLLILLQFNMITILYGIGSLGLVLIYPLMKRITNWPQLILGLAFNWGVLLGWLALQGDIHLATICLYIAGICWTIGYDTIYALQDKSDDEKIGVKSTARLFASNAHALIAFFYASTLIATAMAVFLVSHSWLSLIFLIFPAVHLYWQVHILDPESEARCLMLFRSNHHTGALFFIALAMGAILF